jgi:hypothetical protein
MVRWVLFAAVVVTTATIGAVAAAVWAPGRDQPVTAVPAAEVPSSAVESACGLAGTPGDGTEGAQVAAWVDIGGGWLLPVSGTDGPGVQEPHGPWSCYTRTPSGAVLAGYVIPMRAELADDWQAVVRTQTMPGPGQTAKLAGQPSSAVEPVTLKGFRVVAYSDDRATIGYYLHTPQIEADCTANLAWSDGDWRIQLQDDGGTLSGCQPRVPETFTPWGPR